MKIRVYKEQKKEEELFLRLDEIEGIVYVQAYCDRGAKSIRETLFSISNKGVRFFNSRNLDIGLPLDSEGKIKVLS